MTLISGTLKYNNNNLSPTLKSATTTLKTTYSLKFWWSHIKRAKIYTLAHKIQLKVVNTYL